MAFNSQENKKVVYLTFDDGPSPGITKEISQVLLKNNVKGTFFVVGSNVRLFPKVIKELKNNGMSIMPHTDIHEYKNIYSSKDEYFKDLNNCIETIESVIGNGKLMFVRMPGGSDNNIADRKILDSIRETLKEEGIYNIDWSVDSGDSEGYNCTVELINSHIREYGGLYKVEVVLMHDLGNKQTTVDSLQNVIDFYKRKGYEFKTLDNIDEWEIEYLEKIHVLNK
ncbi:polysaccharide deacetylase family protein [Clostridium carnis]